MIVVDTHSWLWWHSVDPRLSQKARIALDGADTIGVPAICCWEVAFLSQRGRIELDREPLEWLRVALSDPATVLLPLTPEIAVRAVKFGKAIPSDPADRFILATAVEHLAPLVTRDAALAASKLVDTIW